jgi:hypothetical protein
LLFGYEISQNIPPNPHLFFFCIKEYQKHLQKSPLPPENRAPSPTQQQQTRQNVWDDFDKRSEQHKKDVHETNQVSKYK